MRKSISLIIIFFLGIQLLAKSQLQNSNWHDHFSYSNCQLIDESKSQVIVSNGLGLFLYHKIDGSITRVNKTNGLSDIDITALLTLSDNSFIIGYNNGNIDLIENNKIYNIPDLKMKVMQGSKRINHFHASNNKIYCSLDFGIMVINPANQEIEDTYYIGPNGSELPVNQITTNSEFIFAATTKGVYRAPINSNSLGFYDTWQEISGKTVNYSAINNFNNKIFTSQGEKNKSNVISYFEEDIWKIFITINSFMNLDSNGKNLIIISKTTINQYDIKLELQKTISNYHFNDISNTSPSITSATQSDNSDDFYITDTNHGLVINNTEDFDSFTYPDGPITNENFNIAASSTSVYVTVGGLTSAWNNLNRPAQYSHYDGQSWYNFRRNSTNQKGWRDMLNISIDPNNPDHAFICSWGTGVFEISNKKVTNHFDQHTDPNGLQNIEWVSSPYFVRVGGVNFDNNGNLWMTNSGVSAGLVVKAATDSTWQQYTYETLKDLHSMGQIIQSRDNIFWSFIPRTERKGIFVFTPQNTIDDQTDDLYRGAISPASESDHRNAGQLRLWDENGSLITDNIFCLAEDKNGYIWLGTDKGVVVYYRPWAIFNDEIPIASRIKIPRNDGSNLADYLLEKEKVTTIAVDGANRKWLGTERSGVFLVSEDGTKTIHEFNIDNSPLVSNSITSIAVHPKTGEVFIGTAKGIVSYKGNATEGNTSFQKVYAYPNPVRENYSGPITITGLVRNSIVKITDISGKLVYETTSLGGQATWNRNNLWGEKVKTGVYLVFIATEDGSESVATKILVVN
ncbi:T9SS C-terminal target domain-containing protein [Marinilabiliaceae bacterium JC017]|nr:T9SS C-terminal target domain-containing protein [Marinilabiliaceae bacterium JC017]